MTINLLPEQLRGKEPEKQKPVKEGASLEYKKPEEKVEKDRQVEIKAEVKEKGEGAPSKLKKILDVFKILAVLKPRAVVRTVVGKAPSEKKPKPSSIGISLMPEEVTVVRPLFRERLILMIAIVAVIFLLDLLFIILIDWRYNQAKARIANLKTEIGVLEAKTQGFLEKRDRIILLQRKVIRVSGLLENHVYWSNLFNFLETYTIPEVWFGDFATDVSGGIILPAQAKDFISVARQIVVLQEVPLVKEVEVSRVTKTGDGVAFQLKLILDPKIFKK